MSLMDTLSYRGAMEVGKSACGGLYSAKRSTPDYEVMIANIDKQVEALNKFIDGVEAVEEIDGCPCDELCAPYGKAVLIRRGMARNRARLVEAREKDGKE